MHNPPDRKTKLYTFYTEVHNPNKRTNVSLNKNEINK